MQVDKAAAARSQKSGHGSWPCGFQADTRVDRAGRQQGKAGQGRAGQGRAGQGRVLTCAGSSISSTPPGTSSSDWYWGARKVSTARASAGVAGGAYGASSSR